MGEHSSIIVVQKPFIENVNIAFSVPIVVIRRKFLEISRDFMRNSIGESLTFRVSVVHTDVTMADGSVIRIPYFGV